MVLIAALSAEMAVKVPAGFRRAVEARRRQRSANRSSSWYAGARHRCLSSRSRSVAFGVLAVSTPLPSVRLAVVTVVNANKKFRAGQYRAGARAVLASSSPRPPPTMSASALAASSAPAAASAPPDSGPSCRLRQFGRFVGAGIAYGIHPKRKSVRFACAWTAPMMEVAQPAAISAPAHAANAAYGVGESTQGVCPFLPALHHPPVFCAARFIPFALHRVSVMVFGWRRR